MELIRDISEELKTSYIDYAMSVIIGRAIPDVRDGLKPVQRRILYAMYEMNLTSNRPHRKSARIVGDVLGKYHPHGDSAVYDALVRMAQDFSMRYPLIDGQGNFGSIDGDVPAAMRYTEARLTKIAEELLEDIDKDTVDFVPNFDSTLEEPSALPAKIPNLLINGSSGIAVGMATNMPPHNISEICRAIIAYIENPLISIKDLMKIVKGPDFPTGGIIVGKDGIKDVYETGKGKLIVRGRVEFEGNAIIIKEIPYQVNKAKLVEKIAELVRDGKLEEVKFVRDESDREGIRVVIELRRGDFDTVVNKLYAYTQLQTTFGVINLAIVNGTPKILNLKELISEFVNHRRNVIYRRTQYLLKKAEERYHILEGLMIALRNIDEVISIIKSSESPDTAKKSLMERFELSEVQANSILQMRLQRLTALEMETLTREYSELKDKIKDFKDIISSERRIDDIIIKELKEIIEKYGDERRTKIVSELEEISFEDLVTQEDNIIVITSEGYVKRMDIETFRTQRRGGVGVIGVSLRQNDYPEIVSVCNTHHKLLFFTKSKAYWINAYEIPKQDRNGKGIHLKNFISLSEGEKVVSVVSVPDFDGEVVILTEDGYIKRTKLSEFENAKRGGVSCNSAFVRLLKGDIILISTKMGLTAKIPVSNVPRYSRTAKGVRAINMQKGDSIAGLTFADGDGYLLTLTEKGFGKRTPVEEYRLTRRGAKGVRNIRITSKNGHVVFAEFVKGGEELLTMSEDGYAIKISVDEIPVYSRNSAGVSVSKKGIKCAVLI
ncbi:DNA gyrase subunit A [Archaeoglobus sulfaticallidus PM70-1]|uniref:DNA topoisomerase (ATP-hydrolyzing) n=1 Tax=Archaeoglobus sulfaticallidus PM70-1 TaxID=387631 RepID=N0BMQ6_9EURY|nr:DNA gyrase subunit A [Archaeoglobus sulfaticallidus]AGK61906.1 DNA gyrase subunit A [Archaeoglobus sulfaticallidus PM70-1]